MWFGEHPGRDSGMPIGNLTAFLTYIVQILMAVMMATIMFVMVPRAAASAERIQQVLDAEPSVADPGGRPPSACPCAGLVEFQDVEFRYPGAEDAVLCGITFTARPGEITAIVGSTGSGKSTLINLIPRFYDVTGGRVLVDGVDVRDMAQQDLWSRIGFVPQKAFLFSGTVASNLRYGDEDATDEELWHALEIAQGREFVAEMPEGLEAPDHPGRHQRLGRPAPAAGHRPRAGQAPEIYVFDDSFSALDFTTDARLRAALKRETADATVIIVAQRVGHDHARRPHHRDRGRHDRRHGHARRAHGDQRDLPRDRVLAAQRGGGRMSEQKPAMPPGGPRGPGAAPAPAGPAVTRSSCRRRRRRTSTAPCGASVAGSGRNACASSSSSSLAVVSVTFSIMGPKILGDATNMLFDGVVSTQIPAA